jgi:hypothetical protein
MPASWRARACGSCNTNPNRSEDVLKVDADEEGVGGDALRYLVATKSPGL